MKYKIKEFNNYVIENPNYQRKSTRDRFIIFLHNAYKNFRIKFQRIIPLKDWQKSHWGIGYERETPAYLNNSYENTSDEAAYYNVEHLHFFDFFPKEEYDTVINGIKKFYFEHQEKHYFNTFNNKETKLNAPTLRELSEGFSWSNLCGFILSKESVLYDIVPHMQISLVNLTSSYCGIIFNLNLNSDLIKKISDFVLSNVEYRDEPFVPNNFRWSWSSIKKGLGTSWSPVKHIIFKDVLDDVVWRVSKEIRGYIKSLIFQKENCELQYVMGIKTNILHTLNETDDEKTRKSKFWGSLGINQHFDSNFMNENTAYVSFGEDKPFAFIYSEYKPDGRTSDINTYIARNSIGEWCFSYYIAKTVDKNLRKKLAEYQAKVPKTYKRTKRWLKLRLEIERDTFYEQRFIEEYKSPEKYNLRHIGLPKFLDFWYDNIETRISGAKKLCKDIIQSISSRTDCINTLVNYRMQKIALWATGVSLVIAIVALIIALVDSQNFINFINRLKYFF